MAKVVGFGGFFFRCKDRDATRDWYRTILGMELDEYGGASFLHSASAEAFGEGARTIWAPFAADSDYFAPSSENHMINFIVDDLAGILERASASGHPPVKPREDTDYGAFGWLMDPDGRKIELWEPKAPV